jgi:transcriptional regulator with XRE-family HTH domain
MCRSGILVVASSHYREYQKGITMTPDEFRKWRKSLNMTQAQAAETLGIGKRTVATYESDGPVPRYVALACAAIAAPEQAQTQLAHEERDSLAILVEEQHPDLMIAESAMTPDEFRKWRKSLNITQAQAGEVLGIGRRTVATYESDGPIPKHIALACAALAANRDIVLKALVVKSHIRSIVKPLRIPRKQQSLDVTALLKEQHPELWDGQTAIALPFKVQRDRTLDWVDITFSAEAQEWMEVHTPSAKLSLQPMYTPNGSWEVAVVTFTSVRHATQFKSRWSL